MYFSVSLPIALVLEKLHNGMLLVLSTVDSQSFLFIPVCGYICIQCDGHDSATCRSVYGGWDLFTSQMPFLSLNQQCSSSKQSWKHSYQPDIVIECINRKCCMNLCHVIHCLCYVLWRRQYGFCQTLLLAIRFKCRLLLMLDLYQWSSIIWTRYYDCYCFINLSFTW